MTNNPYVIPIAIIVAGLMIAGGLYFGLSATGKATQTAPDTGTKVVANAAQLAASVPYVPYRGSANAPLSIVEFGDYQCPFCERFFTDTEPQIMSDYVKTGKVKFYFMDFAFLGQDSLTLAEGAWCANDQGKYYEYHDYIYSHQGSENSGWGSADRVKVMVLNIPGLDAQKFNSCLDSGKYQQRVLDLTKIGRDAGVTGTPTNIVGNTAVVGASPYSTFKQAIDKQLK